MQRMLIKRAYNLSEHSAPWIKILFVFFFLFFSSLIRFRLIHNKLPRVKMVFYNFEPGWFLIASGIFGVLVENIFCIPIINEVRSPSFEFLSKHNKMLLSTIEIRLSTCVYGFLVYVKSFWVRLNITICYSSYSYS